ncbi:hypothetical protein [Vibrio mangrovi]|uniref:Uncharacterized protein n=1 Tax=Vibrio mangrovi TaxID=474394 RepID=A0A1Y6IY85_9VIBR|nr:hypothetical protein [Vibrio mangrovi]MDW6002489.1 hypothetical protein [Vibrio mangrovi]SMS01981.1 hypothetical protein VIM7927_03292 [Vibrio mangrovi]
MRDKGCSLLKQRHRLDADLTDGRQCVLSADVAKRSLRRAGLFRSVTQGERDILTT